MRINSETGRRVLPSKFLLSTNPEIRDMAKELSDAHGVGIVTQDEVGAEVPIRVNRQLRRWEVFIDGEWIALS